MNCLEAQRLMQQFLEKKLDEQKLHEFVEHIENCPDCREELELNMAVYSTLLSRKQEDRFDYNFVERTNAYVRTAKRYLRRVRARHIMQMSAVILSQLILVLFLFSGVEGKFIRDHGEGIFSSLFSVNEDMEESTEMLSEAVTETESETEPESETEAELPAETTPAGGE